MDKIIEYSNALMPVTEGFRNVFPYISDYQNQSMYVFLPTFNPSTYIFSQNINNVQNSCIEEEILPDFRCKTCSKAIPTFSEFEAHLLTHTSNSLSSPSSAQTAVQSLGSSKNTVSILKPLVDRKYSQEYRCFYCSETFKIRSELSEHIPQHFSAEKVYCTICNSPFTCISSLRKHLSMFHCKDKDRKHCPYCSYRCFQASDLEKHVARRHTRDFKYKCSFCVKGFATPKELENHKRKKHPAVTPQLANLVQQPK